MGRTGKEDGLDPLEELGRVHARASRRGGRSGGENGESIHPIDAGGFKNRWILFDLIHTGGAGIDQLWDGRSTDSTAVMNTGARFRSNRRDRGPLSDNLTQKPRFGTIHPPSFIPLRSGSDDNRHGTRLENILHTIRPVIPVPWPLSSTPSDLTGSFCSQNSTCTTTRLRLS